MPIFSVREIFQNSDELLVRICGTFSELRFSTLTKRKMIVTGINEVVHTAICGTIYFVGQFTLMEESKYLEITYFTRF